MAAQTFLIVDGSSLIHRAFYAMPLLTNAKGEATNAVYGFAMMLDVYKRQVELVISSNDFRPGVSIDLDGDAYVVVDFQHVKPGKDVYKRQVMDLGVADFLSLHAESRGAGQVVGLVEEIIACANRLAGEPFDPNASLTQLSGGQSRALMIADTAMLSASPVVLIDEIENAGVDRQAALELLVRKDKIVFVSTHDPLLALMGQKRLVIQNGGVHKVITTTAKEKENLAVLTKVDSRILALRESLRRGQTIDFEITGYFSEVLK